MKLTGLILSLVLSVPAFASIGRPVSYPSGDETLQGMLYAPEVKGSFPGLVVIHEWWGLNDWVKEQAAKLADQGYVTLAIDLYRGKVAATPDQAHEIMRGVPPDRAARDLAAAVAFLKSQASVRPDRIGSIGWCMGGGYALEMALQDPGLAAAVIHYGHLATETDSLNKIHAAVLGIFGGRDQGIPVADVRKFEQALKQQGNKVEIVIYPDAGHAFENPNNQAGYRADDASDAWNRTTSFLAGTLKK
jgi:carboxymethylenebutenolidase